MTSEEFRNLQHGDKINGNSPGELNFIVHNNHRSGEGMVVAARTEVIRSRDCEDWAIVRKKPQLQTTIGPGMYVVTIDKKIDSEEEK